MGFPGQLVLVNKVLEERLLERFPTVPLVVRVILFIICLGAAGSG